MKDSQRAKNLLLTKDKDISVLSLLKNKKTVMRLFFLFICGYLYVAQIPSLIVGLLTGYIIGLFVEDIFWFFSIKKSWPFTNSVIDWQKVENEAGKDS